MGATYALVKLEEELSPACLRGGKVSSSSSILHPCLVLGGGERLLFCRQRVILVVDCPDSKLIALIALISQGNLATPLLFFLGPQGDVHITNTPANFQSTSVDWEQNFDT